MIEQIKNKIATLVENTRRGTEKYLEVSKKLILKDFSILTLTKNGYCLFNCNYLTDDIYQDVAYDYKIVRPNIDIAESVTNATEMFANTQITDIIIDLKITCDLTRTFFFSTKLETIPLIYLDKSNITFINTFTNCVKLKNISFMGNSIDKSIDFSFCKHLTTESLLSIIENLKTYDLDDENAYANKLTLSQVSWDNLNNNFSLKDYLLSLGITEDELQIALESVGLSLTSTWQDFLFVQGWTT